MIDPRGAHARARYSRRNLVFGWVLRDPDHEATIRFSGEAPRRRAHSRYGFNAMAAFGSPPPRIMISGPRRTLKLDFLLLDQIV